MAKLTNIPENSRLAINRMPIFSEKEKRLMQVAIDAALAQVGSLIDADVTQHNTLLNQAMQSHEDFNNDMKVIPSGGSSNIANGTPRHHILLSGNGTLSLPQTSSARAFTSATGNIDLDYGVYFTAYNAGGGSLTIQYGGGFGELIVNGTGLGMGFDQVVGPGEMVVLHPGATGNDWYVGLIEAGGAGSGDVTKVGTPANDQVGVWTGDGTIEGTSGLTYATTAFRAGNFVFDIDMTVGSGQDNYILTYDWAGTGEIGLEPLDISFDTTPVLGGNLDVGTYEIVSSANNDIGITSNGSGNITLSAGTTGDINLTPGSTSGNVVVDYSTWPSADGTSGYVLTTNGAGALSWTLNGTGTGLGDIVDDLTPQLGGTLDSNNFDIEIKNTGTAKGVNFYEPSAGGSSYVRVVATALPGTYTLTLPTTDGNAGEYLKTDGSGVLSWDSPAGGGATAFTDLTDTPGTIPFAQWLKAAPFGGSLEFTAQPVTTLSATSPLARNNDSGDVTISIQAAAGPDTNGYMLGSDKAKLDTITADADPTTTATVAAAGAVMDSDLPALGLHATSFGGIAGRTLVSSDGTVSITYGDGYAGNPDLSVAGIDGTKVTVSASAPGSPSVGDLWIDIS